MFNLKAPLFKGGWGGSDAIKQPTFPRTGKIFERAGATKVSNLAITIKSQGY